MIVILLKNIQLQDLDNELVSVTYEVSNTMNFSNIVCSSVDDKMNKLGIVFDNDLDPNVKYYCRARLLTKTGGHTYANLTVLNTDTRGYMSQNEDMPTRVATPIITTTSKHLEGHDTTAFKIKVKGFNVLGSAELASVSYFVMDVSTNAIIWQSVEDTTNLSEIDFNTTLLEEDKAYNIMCCFHTSSNDISSLGCIVVTTGGSDVEFLTSSLDITQSVDGNSVLVKKVDGAIYTYEVYAASEKLELIYTATDDNTHLLPPEVIESGYIYLLRVKTDKANIFRDMLITAI